MSRSSIIAGLKTKLLFGAAFVLIVWLVVGIVDALQNKKALDEQLAALMRAKQELEERNVEIGNEITDFQDPEFIEREARRKFNYQREGERVVVFVPGPPASAEATEDGESVPFFTKIKNWFKVIFTRE